MKDGWCVGSRWCREEIKSCYIATNGQVFEGGACPKAFHKKPLAIGALLKMELGQIPCEGGKIV